MVLDNGEYWCLEDFQAEVVEDVFSGVPECWIVIPEGNAKTTLMGGVGCYHVDFTPSANCLVAASSREQAETLFKQAEGLIDRSPGFDKRFRVYPGYRKIVSYATSGTLQVKAADDRTGDGAIPSLGIIDEAHRLRDLKLYRTWRGKLDKRGGQILAISTAGEPASEFEDTRARLHADAIEHSVVGAHHRSASQDAVIHDWHLNAGDDLTDLELVKSANPLSSVTPEILARRLRSPTMTEAHWARFVCNVASSGDVSWIDAESWDACIGRPDLDGVPVVLGVDIGRKKDSTAVIAAGMVDDKLHIVSRIRTPTPGKPVAVADARSVILELAREFDVREVVYDPHQFQESAELLEEQGLLLVEFPQTDARMAPASEALYELIRAGRVVHDGDPVLRSHMLAAVPSETERGVRISKRKSRQQIDGAIASAMAASRALFAAPAPEFVFQVFS